MIDVKKLWRILASLIWRVSPRRRRYLYSVAKRIFRAIAAAAVIWSVASILLNGSEFFTDKLPKAVATVSKHLLLAKTLRPILVNRIAKRELAYEHSCIRGSQLLDLDGNGAATDLLIEFRPKRNGRCTEGIDFGTAYAVLKETGWSGMWPEYTLLRLLSPQTYAVADVGTDSPMNFQGFGSFLVGSVYGANFAGWIVYGYANGELREFGRYKPLGSDEGMESTQPFMQVGSRLFIQTQRDFRMLRITPDGEFIETVMTVEDVVKRNNAAIVLDSLSNPRLIPAEVPEQEADASRYLVSDEVAIEQCGHVVLINGEVAAMAPLKDGGTHCGGEVTIAATNQIAPLIVCEFTGFSQSRQFPWGFVPDDSAIHKIRCPDNSDARGFELNVKVE